MNREDHIHGRRDDWQVFDDLGKRVEDERAAKDTFKETTPGKEMWTQERGLYFKFLETDPQPEKLRTPEGLTNVEQWLMHHILRTLEAKREAGNNSPVLVLDFGGMFGLSFARIAKKLEDEHQLISSGQVVMVVTNLKFDLEEGLASVRSKQRDLAFLFSEEDHKLLQEVHSRSLVHYLQTDAQKLRRLSVPLPDGKQLLLHGNIDIVHESYVLAHGHINDVTLPLIAESMSDFGTLFLGSKDLLYPLGQGDSEASAKRFWAHLLGKSNVRTRMKKQDIPSAEYEVYRKSSAPTVEQPVEKS